MIERARPNTRKQKSVRGKSKAVGAPYLHHNDTCASGQALKAMRFHHIRVLQPGFTHTHTHTCTDTHTQTHIHTQTHTSGEDESRGRLAMGRHAEPRNQAMHGPCRCCWAHCLENDNETYSNSAIFCSLWKSSSGTVCCAVKGQGRTQSVVSHTGPWLPLCRRVCVRACVCACVRACVRAGNWAWRRGCRISVAARSQRCAIALPEKP